MEFCEKKDIFCGLYKKEIFWCSNIAIYWPFFIYFTHVTKNVFSSKNFVDEHKLFRYTPRIFCLIILTFWNVFKMHFP
jgi:hypothetical protein